MTDVLQAKRFMQLFRGYSAAYGTYDPRKLGGSGKQKPSYLTKKQTYSTQEFLAHLNGSSPIGIYPLDDQELVSFAAIALTVPNTRLTETEVMPRSIKKSRKAVASR